jgi:hypothetical protein
MVISGVAGSRPARESILADGEPERTVKGLDGSHAKLFQALGSNRFLR